MKYSHLVRLLASVALIATPLAMQAQTSFVASRASMSGSLLNWNTIYGPNGTSVGAGFTATGLGGLTLSTTGPGSVQVLNQGSGWSGGFLGGEPVLYSSGSPGALSLLFNADIFGLGANLQSNFFGSFTGTVKAYSAANALLGSYDVNGVSNSNGDGSQPFLGIRNVAGMRRVTFEVSGSIQDFSLGLNQATIETTSNTTVPEPSTYLLMASGLAAIAAIRRRRHAATR